MPEVLRPRPAAERPSGRFITEHVLPRWDQLNSYRSMLLHARMVALMLNRRRIHVHRMPGIVSAYLFNGETVGGQQGRLSTLVSDQALEACSSKSLTRDYLRAAGLPVAPGETFTAEEKDAAARFVSGAGNWVVKPDAARRGQGVSFRVTEQGFDTAWAAAVGAGRGSASQVLIDEFQDALSLRFYVVADTTRSVVARLPLFVLGDGASSIEDLLKTSFEARSVNPLLRLTLPEISDQLLAGSGWSLTDIPRHQELVLLGENTNLIYGGLTVDVTDLVHPELNDLATSGAHAIPGLGAGGLDILAPSLDSAEGAVILDADAWANFRLHRYPALGRSRRAAEAAVAEQVLLRAKQLDTPLHPSGTQDSEDD